ncbi:MAG: hypothetical protein KBT58_08235 [Bizionia sp.]|nr:hypothetical protein [Bizionia sp.]
MKTLTTFFLFFCLISFNYVSHSQISKQFSNPSTLNYLERNAIYDYQEVNLNAIDTIPDYANKENKLKIFGTIFESDGTTPAENVLLYIEQTDEFGDFDLRKHESKRYVHHRAWIKTDSNGRYTIYTFIPGNDRRYNLLKQLFPVIKAPSYSEYVLESFLFNDDPLLTKLCRKRLAKKGDITRILNPIPHNDILVVEKNIILKSKKANL